MTEKNEALRLADSISRIDTLTEHQRGELLQAAAELRRLHADAEESEALRERLSTLLKRTAIALRGPEPELTSYGWHDLPERASAVVAQRDALLEALKEALDVCIWPGAMITDLHERASAAIKAVDNSIFNWQQE